MMETEAAGIGFEIEHYLPKEHFPEFEAVYENLMWSCRYCNRNKEDYPQRDELVGDDIIVKIDEQQPEDHFELGEQDRLAGITAQGEFTIKILQLNRQNLLHLRGVRRRLSASRRFIAHGVGELLNSSLDDFEQQHRPLVAHMRRTFAKQYESLTATVDEFIADLARSAMIDPDASHDVNVKERREYLKRCRALHPGFNAPQVQRGKGSPKRGSRKRRRGR